MCVRFAGEEDRICYEAGDYESEEGGGDGPVGEEDG